MPPRRSTRRESINENEEQEMESRPERPEESGEGVGERRVETVNEEDGGVTVIPGDDTVRESAVNVQRTGLNILVNLKKFIFIFFTFFMHIWRQIHSIQYHSSSKEAYKK